MNNQVDRLESNLLIFPMRELASFWVRRALLLLLVSVAWGNQGAIGAERPLVKSGQIDVAGWSMNDPLDLAGDWIFFPKTLLSPEAFTQAYREQSGAFQFTKSGQSFRESNPQIFDRNQSYASYAVILKGLPVSNLALTRAHVYTSGHILLFPLRDPSKVLKMDVGKTSVNAEDAIPAILMENLLPFRPAVSEDYVLIIQISNYHHDWGGFWIPPKLGEFQVLSDEYRASDRLNYWIIGVIFFLTVYHLALFSRRPEDMSSLYLSIFSFVIGFRIYVIGNYRAEFFPVPSWNYEFHLKVVYTTMIIGAALFQCFLQSCFPRHMSKRLAHISLLLVIPPTLFVVLTPAVIYTRFLEPLRLLGFVISFFAIPTYFNAVRARDEGALISFIGSVVVMLGYFFDILNSYGFRMFPSNCAGMGLAFFVICQSQIVAKRFALAFRQSEFLSRELQNEVHRQTRDIKSILTHIRQGIFTLNRENRTIDEQHSEFLKEITGEQAIAGRSIRSLFLDRSNLSEDAKSLTEASLDASLGEDVIAFDVNSGNLVREMEYKVPNGDKKVLELDWSPVVDPKNAVEKLLVSVRDVSELRKLEEEARNREKDLKTILDLIQIPEDRFLRFIEKTRAFIKENRDIISQSNEGKPDLVKRLFVNMHTVKGAARTYSLQAISAASHEVEQTYAALQKQQRAWNQAELLEDLRKVEDAVNFYCSIASKQLGWEFEDKAVKMSRKEIERTLELLIKLEHLPLLGERASLLEAEKFLMEHCYTDLAGVIDEACRGIDSIARDLGKAQPKVELFNSSLVFKDRGVDLLHNMLTHLFRNSLDHGIEHPEVREAKGKPSAGTIRIAADIAEPFVELRFSDDGAGLNLVKLEAIGRQRGLLAQDQAVSDQSIAELIFCSGLSTKDTVSDISGRGVGLDAVKSYLEENGGEVQVSLSKTLDREHVPFVFVLKIPMDFCFLPGHAEPASVRTSSSF